MRKSIPSSKPHCDKHLLRTKKRSELETLPQSYIDESDAAIEAKLLSLPEYLSAKRVFIYFSVGREVKTQGIISHALAAEKPVALPVCENGGKMSFRLVSDLSELSSGKFGIPEPVPDAPELAPQAGDIVIVPALCCDENGNRLGHGAGYYDRYLAKHTKLHRTGIAFLEQLTDEIVEEPYDYRMEDMVTDSVCDFCGK